MVDTDYDYSSFFYILDISQTDANILFWSNKRSEGIISKKLDRALFNDLWLNSFPQSYSVFEAGGVQTTYAAGST